MTLARGPLLWCPVFRRYTRAACDHHGFTGPHEDAQVDDALELADLDQREVDGEVYYELWQAGLLRSPRERPPPIR